MRELHQGEEQDRCDDCIPVQIGINLMVLAVGVDAEEDGGLCGNQHQVASDLVTPLVVQHLLLVLCRPIQT